MSKFHMDLSRFKKVSSDDKTTTLRHEDGHEIKIASSALHPKLRGQLAALPMANEGSEQEVQNMATGTDPGWSQKEREDFSAGASGRSPKASPSPAAPSQSVDTEDAAEAGEAQAAKQYGPAYADGGEIKKENTSQTVGQVIGYPGASPSPEPKKMADGGDVSDLEGMAAKIAPLVMAAMAKGGYISNNPKLAESKKMPPGPRIATQSTPNYSKNIPHLASGGPTPTSDSVEDSPEQIAADASAQAASVPTQAPAASDPALDAKRAAYNQLVQANMYGKTGLTQGNESDADNASFGPDGQPPANFNVPLWNQASAGYDKSQDAELAQKQAATTQMEQDNQARVAAGLAPIPIISDNNASVIPPGKSSNAPTTPQTPADTAIPGDKEMQQLQNGRQAVASSGRSTAAAPGQPSPQDTAQKLVAAKQLTYDALMHERQQMISQLKDATPLTMGKIFDDKSWHGKLGMIAGLMLGGGASAQLGQTNNVANMYQGMIDNNLKAQQLNMQKGENLLSNNLQMTGNIRDAISLSKLQANDLMMHHLVQLAAKYPNNPQIQQNLQAMGMMGMQSSSNIMDTLAANQAWRHAAGQISDPAQKIQFNPMLTPEQKNGALKELGTAQNMSTSRDNLLDAFDKVNKMTAAGTFSPNQRDAIIEPVLAQAVKDSEGRITPQDVPMIKSLFPAGTDVGKDTRSIKRAQLAKFASGKMHFPMLDLAGVNNYNTPQIGGITTGAPNLGK